MSVCSIVCSIHVSCQARAAAWQSVESSLKSQLHGLQITTEAAELRANTAEAELLDASKKVQHSVAEAQQLREEVGHLRSQCEGERSHAALWEQRWNDTTREGTEAQSVMQRKLMSATTHCTALEGKLTTAEATSHLKDQEIATLRQACDHEHERVMHLQNMKDTAASASSQQQEGRPSGLPATGRAVSSSAAVPSTMRTGEVDGMKAQVHELENARTRMAEELVALTTRNNELTRQGARIPKLEAQCKELQRRYMGALEMAGEKDEELEVVQSEMQQLKDVFRTQVVGLMKELDEARAGSA